MNKHMLTIFVTLAAKVVITILLLTIIVLHLFSVIRLDIEGLILMGIIFFLWSPSFIQQRFQTIELPGGFKFELKEQLEKIQTDAAVAGLTLSNEDPNPGRGGGAELPLFMTIGEFDPKLALADFRIELERVLRELAKDDPHRPGPQGVSSKSLLDVLLQRNRLSVAEKSVLQRLLYILDKAFHDPQVLVTRDDILWILHHGSRILRGLEEKVEFLRNNQLGGLG